ncbi:MAG: tetratricopeptide repeat protein [Bacteroidia bacterium]|nr:tetratricopeptide repeat protein [Bacteroidia bacterium]
MGFVYSQDHKVIDSVKSILKQHLNSTKSKKDTTTLNLYQQLGELYEELDLDSAIHHYSLARICAQSLHDNLKEASISISLGQCYYLFGNYDESLKIYLKGKENLKTFQSKTEDSNLKKEKLLSIFDGGIGNIYYEQANYTKALEFYFNALKIKLKIGDKRGQASNLGNIGLIYSEQQDYAKALEYYNRAIVLNKETGNMKFLASNYVNVGNIYLDKLNYNEALHYFQESLSIQKKLGNKSKQAIIYNNIGIVYDEQGDYKKALDFYQNALKINTELGSEKYTVANHINIGAMCIELKKYNEAERHLNIAKDKALEMGLIFSIEECYNVLTTLYKKTNRFKEAFEAYQKQITYRDSIMSEKNQKALVEKEMQFEFDKKQAQQKAEQDKKDLLVQEDKKKQKLITYSITGFAFLLLILALVIFRNLKISQRKSSIITNQKLIIEERHKEITDSIHYAERIQRSLLASKQMLDENLGEYFVFFKPKDVVSGDFYWATSVVSSSVVENFILATADSTGHGVPGAIMSILNIACLNEAVKEGYTLPNEILNRTRKEVINVLKRDGSPEGGKDGMDCSLLVFNQDKTKLLIAAANNPVWIIKNSSTEALEVHEIKPDKMPVGKHDKQHIPFTLHEIPLQKGDVIYTLTDGFPDQFGGEKGKKFMSKNLRELLAANAHLTMAEQKQLLETTFINWKKDVEQVDDVTVIGVRV